VGAPNLGLISIPLAVNVHSLRSAILAILVQPDIQYIMHPGGGASDPNSPSGQRIPDALVLGVRMTVQWGARDPNSQQ
jgi:carbohydrate-selective porin OprB